MYERISKKEQKTTEGTEQRQHEGRIEKKGYDQARISVKARISATACPDAWVTWKRATNICQKEDMIEPKKN